MPSAIRTTDLDLIPENRFLRDYLAELDKADARTRGRARRITALVRDITAWANGILEPIPLDVDRIAAERAALQRRVKAAHAARDRAGKPPRH